MKKSAKGKGHNEEQFGDIMKLLMRFGGFTPPPTPSSSDNSDGEEQWDQKEASQTQVPAQGVSQACPSSEDQKSPRMEQQKQAPAGRGRAQGRGRGRGRGRGGAKS